MSSGQLKQWIRHAALAAVIAMPLAAAAQDAIISQGGNLRAGPGQAYPLVAPLPPGTPATVIGCINGYTWCDVVVPGMRGWLYGGRLDYLYQNAPVPMVNIGAAIGVPIITFSLNAYWGNYYRDRSWYGEPRWWGGRRPPPRSANWRPMAAPGPAWHPRTPPSTWRPPAARPNAGRPGPAARPPAGHSPSARPPSARPPTGGRPPSARPPAGGGQPAARPPANNPPTSISPSAANKPPLPAATMKAKPAGQPGGRGSDRRH